MKAKKAPLTKEDLIFLKKYRNEFLRLFPILMVIIPPLLLLDEFVMGEKIYFEYLFSDMLWIEVPIFLTFLLFIIPLQIHILQKNKFEATGKIERIVTTANKAKLYVGKAMLARYGVVTHYAMLVNGKYYPVPKKQENIIKLGLNVKIGFIKIPKKIISIDIIAP